MKIFDYNDFNNPEWITKIASFIAGLIFALLLVRTKETYFSYIWIVFSAFLIIDLAYSRKAHTKVFPVLQKDNKIILWSIILFYGLLFVASFFNGVPGSYGFSFSLAKFTVPMWMLIYINGKYKALKGASYGIIAGSLISFGVCIYQYFFITHGGRVSGLFRNPNLVGAVLETTIPMLVYIVFSENSKKMMRNAGIVSLIIAYIALHFTGSRGAMFGLLIGTVVSIVMLLLANHKRLSFYFIKRTLLYTMLFCIINGGLLFSAYHIRPIQQVTMSSQQAVQDQGSTGEKSPAVDVTSTKSPAVDVTSTIYQSDKERLRMVKASYEMWRDHKLSGVGMASWKENYYGIYHPLDANEGTDFGMPHNMIMNFLACGGIIGLTGYMIFVIGVGAGIVITSRRKSFLFSAAILAIHIAFFIHGMVDQTIICRYCSYLFYGAVGLYMTEQQRVADLELKGSGTLL